MSGKNSKLIKAPWHKLLRESLDGWHWEGSQLVAANAQQGQIGPTSTSPIKYLFVKQVYATHNASRHVKKAIEKVLSTLKDGCWGINFGSGHTRYHSQLLNVDLSYSKQLDIHSDGRPLPFRDNSLDVVVSQEVIEHVRNPQAVIAEWYRVLKPGGLLYVQAPFQIGYHPGPNDYWRFTVEAWPVLLTEDLWEVEELEIAVGHGTGFYRIAVEFVAVCASSFVQFFYLPIKVIMAISLLPLKLFDLLPAKGMARHRLPGGYYCIARKR